MACAAVAQPPFLGADRKCGPAPRRPAPSKARADPRRAQKGAPKGKKPAAAEEWREAVAPNEARV